MIHVLKTPALYYPDNVDVLEASKQLNTVITAPNRRDGPPGWGSIVPTSAAPVSIHSFAFSLMIF